MKSNHKIAVLLWLYHNDLWPEFLNLLRPINDLIDLHIGLCVDHNSDHISQDFYKYFTGQITLHPNKGVDVLPFLHQMSFLNTENSDDVFLKIHSKKSEVAPGMNWRAILLNSLIGNRDNFIYNIDKFKQSDLGMLCSQNLILSNRERANTKKINKLCQMMGIEYVSVKSGSFPSGNMFFGKKSLFRQYFNESTIEQLDNLFKNERGRVVDSKDGTYCHSLERMFGYLISYNNKKILQCYETNIDISGHDNPNQIFNIVIMYNGDCYYRDNMYVYGNILSQDRSEIVISWKHIESNPIIRYKINERSRSV
jgi:lipopolysaccharide biosynthesis protein